MEQLMDLILQPLNNLEESVLSWTIEIPENYPKLELKRNRIIKELIDTERIYIDNLDLIVTHFMHPLTERLIGHLRDILAVHKELLSLLQERKDEIGQVFVDIEPYLRCSVPYIRNYHGLVSKLAQNMKDAGFAMFIQETTSKVLLKGITFESQLLLPIQRIPRYKLLLTDLLKSTSDSHEDYEMLSLALQRVTQLCEYVNESIRKGEQEYRVVLMMRKFVGYDEHAQLSGLQTEASNSKMSVRLIGQIIKKAGIVYEVNSKGERALRAFVLFNNCLVVAVPQQRIATALFRSSLDILNSLPREIGQRTTDAKTEKDVHAFELLYVSHVFPILDLQMISFDQASHIESDWAFLTDITTMEAEKAVFVFTKIKSFPVCCYTQQEAKDWIAAFQDAREDARSQHRDGKRRIQKSEPLHRYSIIEDATPLKMQRASDTIDEESSTGYHAPLWVPDNASKVCMSCDTEFTMLNRRHHCRMCGILCCHSCSSRTFVSATGELNRACNSCYFELFKMDIEKMQQVRNHFASSTSLPDFSKANISSKPPELRIQTQFKGSISKDPQSFTSLPILSPIVDDTASPTFTTFVLDMNEKSSSESKDNEKINAQDAASLKQTEHSWSFVSAVQHIISYQTLKSMFGLHGASDSRPRFEKSKTALGSILKQDTEKRKDIYVALYNTTNRDVVIQDEPHRAKTLPVTRKRSFTMFVDKAVSEQLLDCLGIESKLSETALAKPSCHHCHEQFGVTRWRHECKKCHHIVCFACAPRRIPLYQLYPSITRPVNTNSKHIAVKDYENVYAKPHQQNNVPVSPLAESIQVRICDMCFYGLEPNRLEQGSLSMQVQFHEQIPRHFSRSRFYSLRAPPTK